MKKYILKRFIKMLFTIWFVFTVVFFLSRVTGDPVEFMTREGASQETIIQLRQQLGLDKPITHQYIESFVGLFNGNYGTSFYYKRLVSELFAERMIPTIIIGTLTLIITIVIGISFGLISAINHNTIVDKIIMILTVFSNTVPNFVLGIFLMFIFSLKLRLLPSNGFDNIKHLIMPLITMSVGPTSSVTRLTRSSLLDILSQDYLNTCRAKGLAEWIVIIKHGLRNSLIPVITILGSQLSFIIGGSVVVETVFALPGTGNLIVSSAQQRDFPVAVFGVIIIAFSVSFINFFVDISYAFLDPRIRQNNREV